MPVLSLACHLRHNTPNIPSRYNNEQTTKQTKAISNSYIYINISCKCDTNRAGHFTLDAYASRPVACYHYSLHLASSVTHWDRDKMAIIFQTIFWDGFSWMKMYEYRLKFHSNLFVGPINNFPSCFIVSHLNTSQYDNTFSLPYFHVSNNVLFFT